MTEPLPTVSVIVSTNIDLRGTTLVKIVFGIPVPGRSQARRRERLQEIESSLHRLAEAKLLRHLVIYLLANLILGGERIRHKIEVRQRIARLK